MLSPYTIDLPITHGVKYPPYGLVYDQLTDEQKKVIKTKKIESNKTSDEWLEFLNGLALHDKVASLNYAKVIRRKIVGAVLIGVVFLTLLGWLAKSFLAVFFGLIGLFFLFAILHQLYSDDTYDTLFPDYLHTVLLPLMIVLREETEPNTIVYMKVDLMLQLHPSRQGEFLGKYEWPFLDLSTKFSNQVDFQLNIHIQNLFRQRKAKSKRRVFINMVFLYPKKAYQKIQLDKLGSLWTKIKTKEKPQRHVLLLREILKYKSQPFRVSNYYDVPINVLLKMMREGYKPIQ